MCSLCGVISGRGHWTEAQSQPQVFAARAVPITRAQERRHRIALVNRVLAFAGLSAREWGNQYLLRTATGKTVLVDHLTALWQHADTLTTKPLDPLDPALLQHLERIS